MTFWIIENGEKEGPFQDYQIRSMIGEGRIVSDTRIWHEDAEGWQKISEVDRFASAFALKSAEPPPLPEEQAPVKLWERLGARWFDLILYNFLMLLIFKIGGRPFLADPQSESGGMMIILMLLPVIIIEGVLLSSFGRTPGKYLLGLTVTDREGQFLTTGAATIRAMRVWVLGMGMRHPFLMIIGHAVSLWLVKKKGAPLWDLAMGYQVRAEPLGTPKVVRFVALFVLVLVGFFVVLWPEFEPMVRAEMERQSK